MKNGTQTVQIPLFKELMTVLVKTGFNTVFLTPKISKKRTNFKGDFFFDSGLGLTDKINLCASLARAGFKRDFLCIFEDNHENTFYQIEIFLLYCGELKRVSDFYNHKGKRSIAG